MRLTTRSRIMDYLRKYQSASARELSLALAKTGANVRYHLAVLESTGLVEFINQRREGRGRPEKIYGLPRRVLGEGLDALVGAVLDAWLKNKPDAERGVTLRAVAQRLGGENLSGTGVPLQRRLAHLMNRLNELHYQARWEAGVTGPYVILGNCPYAAIIGSHPELCSVDAFLIEQQSGLSVEQTAKLQPSNKGYPYCTFHFTTDR